MTATIILIRHAAHGHLGQVLSGRMAGLALSESGRGEAAALARRLQDEPVDLIQTSPVQRARETAQAIAELNPGIPVEKQDALDELDLGEWTGRAFAELDADPRWHAWNSARASAECPGGETMAAAQARAWQHIETAAAFRPEQTIAMISHCDIIRAVVARVLDLSLDCIHRFDIDPASLTRLAVGPWGAKVLSLNEGCHE